MSKAVVEAARALFEDYVPDSETNAPWARFLAKMIELKQALDELPVATAQRVVEPFYVNFYGVKHNPGEVLPAPASWCDQHGILIHTNDTKQPFRFFTPWGDGYVQFYEHAQGLYSVSCFAKGDR
jgi:hypothetical protein